MKKPMIIMLSCLGVLFGFIIVYKVFISMMTQRYIGKMLSRVAYVSAAHANYTEWQPQLEAVGNIRAVMGVNVTVQLAGMVSEVNFTPGADVKQGDLLLVQNIAPEQANLAALQANAELAQITYNRDKAQYAAKAISKETLDTDEANLKNTTAQVAQQQAVIDQKTIRAPFAGRLGISNVYPGQFLNPGDSIVMLQTLDPIYVDFYVPQAALAKLQLNQKVNIKVDTFPKQIFSGKITTINPGVDSSVRNVEVEATIANPDYKLAPGMFADVTVDQGTRVHYLTVPQTAIAFNPYGEIVYIVKQTGTDKDNKPVLKVLQTFVTTGEKRGDQVAVIKGLKAGDIVVTSGQLKLKNGSAVVINNAITPSNDPHPNPITQ